MDLDGLNVVIDERAGINGVEYLCLFDDERTEWLPVPSWMDAFADFKKYKADHTEKEGPEVLKNLSEWVKSDFIDDD